jgi:hypothetical protein
MKTGIGLSKMGSKMHVNVRFNGRNRLNMYRAIKAASECVGMTKLYL